MTEGARRREHADIKSRSHFVDEVFEALEMDGERLTEKEFDGCTFLSCSMRELRLNRCRFSSSEFRSSDLTLLRLGESSFRDVRFVDCRLIGLDWTQVEATLGLGVAFARSVLDSSSFVGLDLEELQVLDCRASELNFSGARLRNACFRGTSLRGSRFGDTDLTGADLSGATEVQLDPRTTRLKETKLSPDGAMNMLEALGIVLAG